MSKHDAQPETTPDRTPAGRVWMEIVNRHHNAARAQDEPRRVALMELFEAIEREFPGEVEAERKFWKGDAA